jgi:hypothetical protein
MWDESADTHMAFIDKTRKTSRPVHPVPIAGTWVVDRGAVTVWLSCANAGACPAVDNRAVRNLHLDSGDWTTGLRVGDWSWWGSDVGLSHHAF